MSSNLRHDRDPDAAAIRTNFDGATPDATTPHFTIQLHPIVFGKYLRKQFARSTSVQDLPQVVFSTPLDG